MATATAPMPSDSATNTGWKPELHDIPLDAIDVGSNVRTDVGDVTELAASIETHGLLSPIRVAESGAGRYELVYGQRRLAAARHIGLPAIPAIVDGEQLNDQARTVEQLLENLQREDLNALDTAKAYRQLLDHGLTQRELAEQIGVSQPTIANTLALLKAPEAIQAHVAAGELTRSHVEAIAKLPKAEQEEVARRVVEHGLSTRDVELEIDRAAQRAAAADRQRDERRHLADATEAALAKKKRATKEAARLFSYDAQIAHELKQRGWQVLDERPGYYGAPKGCDCLAWTVSRNYMGNKLDTVTLTAQCIDAAHVKAANDAAEEDRAKRRAEAEAAAQAEREANAKAMAPIVERLTADPKLRARVALWVLCQNGWGGAYEQFETEMEGGSSWAGLAKLADADVERWTIALLAEDVHDAPEVRAEVAAPKPDRPPKPPKPPKAREQG